MIKKNILLALTLLSLSTPLASHAQAPGILQGISNYDSNRMPTSSPKAFTYLADGESYLMLSEDRKKIIKYETSTGKETGTVIDLDRTRENTLPTIGGYIASPNGAKLLIYSERRSLYRYSFYARYYVYDVHDNTLKPLSTEHPWQRNPLFSPDGTMVAFVSDNNIYLKKLMLGTESAVTTDGVLNEIINGVPDWGYDEEFDITCAMTWSPDNNTLVYLKFNESKVPMFTFPLYQGTCPSESQYAIYPGIFSYKYSVPGEPNSTVSLHSFDIDNRKTKDIPFPGNPEYITRFWYAPGNSDCLLVTTLNREQTRMELFSANPKSTTTKSLLVEQPGAWVMPETYENIKLLPTSFVIMSPRSGYTHLYEYSYEGQLLRTITSGNFDVFDYYGCDAQGNHYYQSDATGPVNRVVSRIDKKNNVTDISSGKGVARANFSPACNYFVLTESSSTKAPDYTLYNTKLKKLRVLAENGAVTARYASLPHREFIKVPSAQSGLELNAYIIKPANFDPSKKYPLIVWQYSGPGSASVLDSWSIGWEQFATVDQGYIVACVDPRGTAGRGYEFMTSVYRHLGRNETADQCAAARYFASLPYVDGSKIGIAGWSYGGYETLMSISAPDTPFKAGVSIAPVTSWRYYDSIYTERYMLTPAQNPEGYDSSAPVNLTATMNVPLLLMHGTADDNVHFTNTVEYLTALQAGGKLCNLMIFPNKNHSIAGCNARELVYSNMISHFNTYLK